MPDIPATMRAIVMAKLGRPRVLKDARCPTPQIAADEALLKVHATSVNADDLAYRSGGLILRKPMPHILGGDVAGEIVALGADCGGWTVGERVAACFRGLGSEINGGYAEYCALPCDKLAPLPEGLDFTSAAAAGASFADAYTALINRCQINKNDRVVIFGAEKAIAESRRCRSPGRRERR